MGCNQLILQLKLRMLVNLEVALFGLWEPWVLWEEVLSIIICHLEVKWLIIRICNQLDPGQLAKRLRERWEVNFPDCQAQGPESHNNNNNISPSSRLSSTNYVRIHKIILKIVHKMQIHKVQGINS